MNSILALICLVLGVLEAEAALATFKFTVTNPGQNSPWNTGTTTDPNASTTGFTLGPGVLGNTGNNRFNANSWSIGTTLASALSGNDYFGFVLSVNSGFAADLNNAVINLTLQTSWTGTTGTGPKNYAVFSSIGGFTEGNELQQGTVAGIQSFTPTFGSSGNDNATGNIEFRIYGWNATSTVGTMSDNALSLGGTIAAVPEPVNVALGVFGIGFVGVAGGRWLLKRRLAEG